MTGTCRFCGCKVLLRGGKWLHGGIGTLVHIIRYQKEGAK